jgi:hypothetical protein
MGENILSVNNDYSVEIDGHGNYRRIVFRGEELRLPIAYTFYEINGLPARAKQFGEDSAITLASDQAEARLTFSADAELSIHVEGVSGDTIESWSITLPFPLETVFHLPEFVNTGRMLDKDIPVADFYGSKLAYNFLLAGCEGIWMRFLSEQRLLHRLGVHIERHDEMFLVTVSWHAGKDDRGGTDASAANMDARLGFFPSLDAAMEDYECFLEKDVGVTPVRRNRALPEWVHNVKLEFEVDMMRPYGQVSHDYEDVVQLAEDLKREGCPADTVFHLPGWNAAFDSDYPTYRPCPELGGEAKLKEMVDTVHRCGFRVMLHTLGWGIDPFHEDIDRLLPLVLKGEDGNLQGYKLSEDTGPPSRRIRFRTDPVELEPAKGRQVSVESVVCPALCEAMITIGALRPQIGRIRITINNRTHLTPADWFSSHEEYQIPFPIQLNPGRNTIDLEALTEVDPDWSGCWYRIDSCFAPDTVHSMSTRPILMADTAKPEWIQLYGDEVVRAITEYDFDMLYVDCTTFYNIPGSQKLFESLRQRLPNTPLNVEWCDSIEELGWFAFMGGAVSSLFASSYKLLELSGRKKRPIRRGIEERYRWLDKSSPVCAFVKKYTSFTSQLMFLSFVPVSSVVNVYPNLVAFTDVKELRTILKDANRLNFIPMMQLNYREYGLDDEMKRFVHSIR